MSTAEVLLLIERPTQQLNHCLQALAALDAAHALALKSVIAYYDAATEHALLRLQYASEVFDEARRQYVVDVVVRAELGMIQPDQLGDDERKRFFDARLARCVLQCAPQRTVAAALKELVSMLPSVAAKGTQDLLDEEVPRQHEPIHVSAKGTRDDLADVVPIHVQDSHNTSRYLAPRTPRASPPPELASRSDRIEVRYMHGGRWLPARVGAIGLDGATLLASALPHARDLTEIELSFRGQRASGRGVVVSVSSTQEALAIGAGVFRLKFVLDEQLRHQLPALLIAVREANVTIEPPPRRAARRFPVTWLVALGTTRGMVKATALDVSAGGLFVRPNLALSLDGVVTFSLDGGEGVIGGRAKVVRRLSDSAAKTAGLVGGVGLEIVEMTAEHRERWSRFLARIEQRAEKRVLIGADPARFAELRAGLASAGYTVISGDDARSLVERGDDGAPADAVLIDARWQKNHPAMAVVEELVTSRNVPCVKAQGDVVGVREAIDRLLDVH